MHLPRGGHCVSAPQAFSQYVLVKHNEQAPFHNPGHMGVFFRLKPRQRLCAGHSLSSPLPPVDDCSHMHPSFPEKVLPNAPARVSFLDMVTREQGWE